MKKISGLFIVLAVLFCTALITSNIIAGKLYAGPFGLVFTAGVWLFPIVYILNDVVPECYGWDAARRVIWLGFFANAVAVAFFWLTITLPFPPFWKNQDAFATVLGFTPRLLLASFVGYLVGTHVNSLIIVVLKRLTNSRWLWMRTIGSTIIGESLDSTLFISIAFFGIVPSAALPMMIVAQAGFKIIYEIVATPLTYAVVAWVKKYEGVN